MPDWPLVVTEFYCGRAMDPGMALMTAQARAHILPFLFLFHSTTYLLLLVVPGISGVASGMLCPACALWRQVGVILGSLHPET